PSAKVFARLRRASTVSRLASRKASQCSLPSMCLPILEQPPRLAVSSCWRIRRRGQALVRSSSNPARIRAAWGAMIERAITIRFDRQADAGRNRPLRVGVQTPDNNEHDVFLKPFGPPEIGLEGMANEVVAACLAQDLGLPSTKPYLVQIDPDLVQAIQDADAQQVLRSSVPIAFGLEAAGNQWNPWSAGDK